MAEDQTFHLGRPSQYEDQTFYFGCQQTFHCGRPSQYEDKTFHPGRSSQYEDQTFHSGCWQTFHPRRPSQYENQTFHSGCQQTFHPRHPSQYKDQTFHLGRPSQYEDQTFHLGHPSQYEDQTFHLGRPSQYEDQTFYSRCRQTFHPGRSSQYEDQTFHPGCQGPYEDQIFHLSGPQGLTHVNWKNAAHVIAVVACLVQCVYVLELDRQKKRKGDKALAPPWRETFGFQLKRPLVDKADSSIFGAIFEYNPPPYSCNHSAGGPRFVVAFRGTLLKKKSFLRDTWLDFQVILNNLHSTSRCQTAIQEVEDLVATAGYSGEVWLTGHSLGSAIALQAGKNMAKKEVYLESLLFNPPYPSVPTEKIKSKSLKLTLHLAKSVLRAGVAVAKQSPLQRKQSESSFAAMSPWVPKLFVNEADYVCFEYIGYFGYGNWMRKHGLENIYKFASQYSLRSLLFMSKKEAQAEPLHLIPSANLTINSKPPKWFLRAHGISEWWKPNLELESEVYQCEY